MLQRSHTTCKQAYSADVARGCVLHGTCILLLVMSWRCDHVPRAPSVAVVPHPSPPAPALPLPHLVPSTPSTRAAVKILTPAIHGSAALLGHINRLHTRVYVALRGLRPCASACPLLRLRVTLRAGVGHTAGRKGITLAGEHHGVDGVCRSG